MTSSIQYDLYDHEVSASQGEWCETIHISLFNKSVINKVIFKIRLFSDQLSKHSVLVLEVTSQLVKRKADLILSRNLISQKPTFYRNSP